MLISELIVAVGLLVVMPIAPPAGGLTGPTSSTEPVRRLVDGDDRTIELISLGGRPTDDFLTRVAAGFGTANAAVEAFWGSDWRRDVIVVATASRAQFTEYAKTPVTGNTAAVAVADSVDSSRRFVVGQRIVFAPGAVAMSEGALRMVLTHELFHYAARVDTAAGAPRWLTEGVADFIARPDASLPSSTALPLRLPSDADLDASEPQRSMAYDRAWWFARFVADTYGTAKLRMLYLAACGFAHTDVSTAVRDVLGMNLPGVLARWQRWPAR